MTTVSTALRWLRLYAVMVVTVIGALLFSVG